ESAPIPERRVVDERDGRGNHGCGSDHGDPGPGESKPTTQPRRQTSGHELYPVTMARDRRCFDRLPGPRGPRAPRRGYGRRIGLALDQGEVRHREPDGAIVRPAPWLLPGP